MKQAWNEFIWMTVLSIVSVAPWCHSCAWSQSHSVALCRSWAESHLTGGRAAGASPRQETETEARAAGVNISLKTGKKTAFSTNSSSKCQFIGTFHSTTNYFPVPGCQRLVLLPRSRRPVYTCTHCSGSWIQQLCLFIMIYSQIFLEINWQR